MTKYKIVVKQDFGKYGYWNPETRQNERTGFIVTDGICNIIPGACWFRTVEQAMRGIRAHIISGDTMEWHDTYKRLGEEDLKSFWNQPRGFA